MHNVEKVSIILIILFEFSPKCVIIKDQLLKLYDKQNTIIMTNRKIVLQDTVILKSLITAVSKM